MAPHEAQERGYARLAPQLLDMGYAPIPIRPGRKSPAPPRWSSIAIDTACTERWCREFPDYGVGLRTGDLVGLDIDILDADLSHELYRLAVAEFGDTLLRIGLWPKRLLIYRTGSPFRKLSLPGIEILGLGQQCVVFGTHPATRQPYSWPLGDNPLDTPLDQLPLVEQTALEGFLGRIAPLLPPRAQQSAPRPGSGPVTPMPGPVRDREGLVIDGRDGWLSTIAFHAVQDALATRDQIDPERIADEVWLRFVATTDLTRARQDGAVGYGPDHARRKVADKLRLHRDGRLPARDQAKVQEADYHAPTLSLAEGRTQLEAALGSACERIFDWHQPGFDGSCPNQGVRATVGLGKSVAARRHLMGLRSRLIAASCPSRILILTPTHALAEETARSWRENGVEVAVLRGYEARHPDLRKPMCRDFEAVRLAIEGRLDVQSTACLGDEGASCRHYRTCLKQQNRREVAIADIVVAPYDALFTGFAVSPDPFAVILIDEACWPRAIRTHPPFRLDDLVDLPVGTGGGYRSKPGWAGDAVDLRTFRLKAHAALRNAGPGAVQKQCLVAAGLTAQACRGAADLERRRRCDPGLKPGLTGAERALAMQIAVENSRADALARLWRGLARLLEAQSPSDGRLRITGQDASMSGGELHLTARARVHHSLQGIPVLHLDATLRPELAGQILPDLDMAEIDVAAPHMSVRLVAGSFGKAALAPDQQTGRVRLAAIRDYIRWQARQVAPGRVLVITYKSCKRAFEGLSSVEVAHYNAIAGIDRFRDVAALILVGRPLPRDSDLAPLVGAMFESDATGGYRTALNAVRMRSGGTQAVRIIQHGDDHAETLRAAICDDELIQAIGRGRGVSRTAANPLAVHVLADAALPLIHDVVTTWDLVEPDLIQRMLLDGIAVDSPADACLLHPRLLANEKQAQKAFSRIGFKRQFPISNLYKEMSLKSAEYRLPGRGKSRQRAWWIDGTDEDVRSRLEAQLGPLAEWVATP